MGQDLSRRLFVVWQYRKSMIGEVFSKAEKTFKIQNRLIVCNFSHERHVHQQGCWNVCRDFYRGTFLWLRYFVLFTRCTKLQKDRCRDACIWSPTSPKARQQRADITGCVMCICEITTALSPFPLCKVALWAPADTSTQTTASINWVEQ